MLERQTTSELLTREVQNAISIRLAVMQTPMTIWEGRISACEGDWLPSTTLSKEFRQTRLQGRTLDSKIQHRRELRAEQRSGVHRPRRGVSHVLDLFETLEVADCHTWLCLWRGHSRKPGSTLATEPSAVSKSAQKRGQPMRKLESMFLRTGGKRAPRLPCGFPYRATVQSFPYWLYCSL